MKKCLPTTNSSNHRNIFGGGGGIILHGLEYLIRREVVFCFIFFTIVFFAFSLQLRSS